MTNFDKLLETDREALIKAISQHICINTYNKPPHVNRVNPPLCGECQFCEVHRGGRTPSFKCHDEWLLEWLNEEVKE